jgi:hypothetical protein
LRILATEAPQTQRGREREIEEKIEKAKLYPCEPSVHSSLLLCGSVALWLISAIENFITNNRMRTPASSENLNKRALDPLALFVTRPESKSTFDSKIASVMKAPQTCVA